MLKDPPKFLPRADERRPTLGHITMKCQKEGGRADTLKTARGNNTGLGAGRHETRPPNPEDNSVQHRVSVMSPCDSGRGQPKGSSDVRVSVLLSMFPSPGHQ